MIKKKTRNLKEEKNNNDTTNSLEFKLPNLSQGF